MADEDDTFARGFEGEDELLEDRSKHAPVLDAEWFVLLFLTVGEFRWVVAGGGGADFVEDEVDEGGEGVDDEGSLSPDPNKATLSRAILSRLYGPLQSEVARICGLLTTNPENAAKRLSDLNRELINHTLQ